MMSPEGGSVGHAPRFGKNRRVGGVGGGTLTFNPEKKRKKKKTSVIREQTV